VLAGGHSGVASAQTGPEQIFKKENLEVICTKGTPRIVDRFALATQIVYELKIPYKLMTLARPDGGESDPPGRQEFMHFVKSDLPFGPNPRPEYADLAKAAVSKRLQFMLEFQIWLLEAARSNSVYRVQSSSGKRPTYEEYFADGSGVQIVCGGEKPGRSSAPTQSLLTEKGGEKIYESVMVRKTVAQLATPRAQLKKADGAQFSFTDDRVAGRKIAEIEGVLGFKLVGTSADRADKIASRGSPNRDAPEQLASYWFNITPYVYMKRKSVRPEAKSPTEQDVLQPGAALNLTWVSASGVMAFDLQASGSQTIDRIQGSRLTTGSLRVSPSFLLPGWPVIFNAPVYLGFATVRPDLSLLARTQVIGDAGTNKQLQASDSFFSVGGDASIRVLIPNSISWLQNLQFKAEFLYLFNSNQVVDVVRWTAGLSYQLPGVENVTFDMDYVDGRDDKTLLMDKKWTAAISFRY